MDKNAVWKWLILFVLFCLSMWVVYPPSKKVRLGLDLKGGISFVVKIDEQKIRREIMARPDPPKGQSLENEVRDTIRGAQERAVEVIRNRIDGLGIAEPSIYPGGENQIIVQLPGVDQSKRMEAEEAIKSVALLEFRLVHKDNQNLVAKLFEKKLAPDGFEIADEDGLYRKRADYDEVAKGSNYFERLSQFQVSDPRYDFMLEKTTRQKQVVYRAFYVRRAPELTGALLKRADVGYQGPLNQPKVDLTFTTEGGEVFGRVTSRNVGEMLGIVLDGALHSAPVINGPIHGGRAEITGDFDIKQATFLRNILNAGKLPAPVNIVETRFVAPSLGKDSIESGIKASIYGTACVVAFMLFYYHLCGVVANIALFLNLILMPLAMVLTAGFLGIFARDAMTGGASVQLPVLTLPGIAGIVLSIGMAVDANVLIFERIREELKSGKRLATAMPAGFDRAFVTILDSNLTTILTGVILFVFGSGPIRGFAVTLCAGLIVNLYTGVSVTKLVLTTIAESARLETLKMRLFVKETAIDFIGKWKMAVAVSLVVILGTWAVMTYRGMRNPGEVFGIDFTGGTSATLTFKEKVPVNAVRDTLAAAGLREVNLQYQAEVDTVVDKFLQVRTGSDPIDGKKPALAIRDALQKAFPQAGFEIAQEDTVGPAVGEQLKRKAGWAMILSLAMMIVYVGWRFEFGFALGAVVALFHDALVTTGVFCILDRQLSLTFIASLLTIVGYSVNDTIVIFDRIRENLRAMRGREFVDICNISINQTLGRTILTSFTVMLVVVALLVFGGGAINDFALAMFIGIITGTYSTVYIATPVVLLWYRNRKPELGAK